MNDFWTNVSRYPRFFFSSLAGSFLVILTPLKNLLRVSKFRIGLLFGIFFLLFAFYTVLRTMVGL